ncbi:MAG: YraN family protein [Treponema sp.]
MTGKQLGNAGEERAAEWIIQQGYHIIARNWRKQTGEIDIIAQKNDTLVFIEVKTLVHTAINDLDIIINARKQERICKTAKYFLALHREYNKMHVRFDVIVIPDDPIKKRSVEPMHLENAFEDYI